MSPVVPSLRVGPLALRVEEGALVVEDVGETADEARTAGHFALLPVAAARMLIERYGRPLDDATPPPAARLPLDGTCRLATLSYRSPLDVIANDYVLLERGTAESPLAVPAPRFVAALRALVQAAARRT